MKPFALLLAASALLVSACADIQGSQDPDGYRDTATRGSLLHSSKSFAVARPVSSVTASVRSNLSRCFNRTVEQQIAVRGGNFYSAVYSTQSRTLTMSTKFRSVGAGGETTVYYRQHEKQPLGLLPQGGVGFVVDTKSAPGGTAVTVNAPRFGAGGIRSAVESWAQGRPAACPEI